jgi:hypothetical protein
MAKHILKKSSKDCCVKISGTNGTTETISLSTDLLLDDEIVSSTKNPKVNLVGLTWTGVLDSMSQIKRNNVVVSSMQANTTGQFDFEGQGMCPDNVENESDLVVSITGGQHEVWIRLHKVDGYESKIETGVFSVYDDVTKVGE